MNNTVIVPVTIPVFQYFRDHYFEGKTVLPAVEAMRVLSRVVMEFAPQIDIAAILEARFEKFLVIPSMANTVEAQCRLTISETGSVEAVLQTRTRIGKVGYTRVKEHARARYCQLRPQLNAVLFHPPETREENSLTISKQQVYRQLIPFGPAYQNINQDLRLFNKGAVSGLKAPLLGDADGGPSSLGSPFVLDAAFHAACVWGQRYCGVIAFPVGIEKRVVIHPTHPGQVYSVHVFPKQVDQENLFFDMGIFGSDDELFEAALGVHMRDVSSGRLTPPDWIRVTA